MEFSDVVNHVDRSLTDFRENDVSCISYTTEKLLWAQTEAILLFIKAMCIHYDRESADGRTRNIQNDRPIVSGVPENGGVQNSIGRSEKKSS